MYVQLNMEISKQMMNIVSSFTPISCSQSHGAYNFHFFEFTLKLLWQFLEYQSATSIEGIEVKNLPNRFYL